MKRILKKISRHKKVDHITNKKRWYKVGKYLRRGQKMDRHKESKLAAKRTYLYYKVNKGDWEGPTPRKLSKIPQHKFDELLKRREEIERGILLTIESTSDQQSRDDARETCDESHVEERSHEETSGSTEMQTQDAKNFLLQKSWNWWDLQGATPEGCGI